MGTDSICILEIQHGLQRGAMTEGKQYLDQKKKARGTTVAQEGCDGGLN